MLFTSAAFVGFLAAVLLLYYLVPKKLQWLLLLAANLLFYACAGLSGLIFLLGASAVVWLGTNLIDRSLSKQKQFLKENKDLSGEEKKSCRKRMQRTRTAIMVTSLLLLLGVLSVLKYTNFVINNVNSIFGTKLIGVDWLLPMGISFFTFQAVAYVIDVYWEKVQAQKNPLKITLFISFFPLLIQGPICRYQELSETLFAPHKPTYENLSFGLQRIIWGYFKKLVIADRLLIAVTTLCGNPETYCGGYFVLAALLYAIELYADFTGGIDITIGIAQMMGIKLPENFRRPYLSRNIAEYWRRWHISMGTWFKDYIFYPISVSKGMLTIAKRTKQKHPQLSKKLPVYIATIVTWFLTGLWHGAAWNFVVWGLLNAVFILAAEEFKPISVKFRSKYPRLTSSRGYHVFEILRTFCLMSCIRMLDCYRDVPVTFRMFGSVFTKWNWSEVFSKLCSFGLSASDYIIVGIGVAMLIGVSLYEERRGSIREALKDHVWLNGVVFTLLILAILVFGAYGIGYDSAQFIYNQF